MLKIDGLQIAAEILEKLKTRKKPSKFFAAFLIGSDASSVHFLEQKKRIAEKLKIDFRIYKFSFDLQSKGGLNNDFFRREIGKIVRHKTCGAAIIQLPLPSRLNRHYLLNVLPVEKDVDVLGERALGAFYTGRSRILPPSVGVVKEIIKFVVAGEINKQDNNGDDIINNFLSTKKVAVVGLGFLIGKPVVNWLIAKCPEIFLLDKGGDFNILKEADLVISGVGKSGLIKQEILKNGAGIIDFGYSVDEGGKISGDFNLSQIKNLQPKNDLNFWTPVPGGTGPILVAKIFENFFDLND